MTYKTYKTNSKAVKGFTLIELIVVMAIIGVLATLLINNLNDARTRARDAKRKQELTALKTALRLYYNDYQKYPAGSAGNNDILGCGAVGATACGGAGSEFATTGTSYMKRLPEFSYYAQTKSGDGFTLKVALENLSDPDLAPSQTKCLGAPDGSQNFAVCED